MKALATLAIAATLFSYDKGHGSEKHSLQNPTSTDLHVATEFTNKSEPLQTDTKTVSPVAPTAGRTETERVRSLLDARFGFGENTVGGAEGVMTKITNLEDSSLFGAIMDTTPRWIYFDPALNGQTWQVPAGRHAIPPNKTIDACGVDITWQFGTPDAISSDAHFAGQPTTYFQLAQGEVIIAGVEMIGDMALGAQTNLIKNGTTDGIEILDGDNYFIAYNDFTRMSDESSSVYHGDLTTAKPNNITYAYNHFYETRYGQIVGNQWITNYANVGAITQAYNWYRNTNGRSPGLYHHMNAHVFNNVAENYHTDGITARNGAEVLSEANVINPGCSPKVGLVIAQPAVSGNLPAPEGKINSIGDFTIIDTNPECGSVYNGNSNSPTSFSLPYTHVKRAGAKRQEIEAYVKSNAGATNCH